MDGTSEMPTPNIVGINAPTSCVYSTGTSEDIDGLPEGMMRLDAPSHAMCMSWDSQSPWSVSARIGSRLVGVATVTREHLAGPPMRGMYRMAGTAASTRDDGIGVIKHCIASVAADGGSTLWCLVPLHATGVWRECGFAMAGEVLRAHDGGAAVMMVRTIVPADAGNVAGTSKRGAQS